jgi:acyl carrier protein
VVSDVGWEAVALEPAGAFLWVGGLGPAAQELAALWAGRPGARLAVAEGPGFPAVEDWEEWLQGDGGGGLVSQRIQHLRTLEAAGAELLVTTADPRDRERLAAMLAEVQGRWGTLHGVALTVEPGSGGDALDSAVALHGALAGLAAPPVVRLLLSTAADATGGALLDAFAARAAEDGWTSVAWDLEPPPAAPSTARREVLERLLAAPVGPQVVVSASLPPGPWHRSRAEERETAMTPRTGAMGFYPRPQLAVEFVAPRNPTEETIARAWCELLGLEQVGVHDSFLDLGGDSLLATRLVSRLRESLALDLPIRLVFEASTVAELAAAIESSRERAEAEDLEELLALVEGLSEDEIEEQLRARRELSGKEA